MTVDEPGRAHRPLHVLVVGNGREIPPMLHVVQPGVRTTLMVRVAKTRRVREPGRHERIIGLPHDDGAEWVATAREVHARDPFDRIGSFTDVDQEHAAAIGAALGLPTHSVDTVRWAHDKLAMRQRLAEMGLERVAAGDVRSAREAASFAATHGYPLVLKPVAGAGSSGVSVVRGPDDLDAAWAWGQDAREPDDPALMVESFLEGRELSVEAFTHAGVHHVVALTDKRKEPRHFVEVGHIVQGDFPAATASAVRAHVRQVLDALGVREGITHTELILTADGPRVVETHLRRGGDGIVEAIRDTWDLDLVELLVRQTLGEDVAPRLAEGVRRVQQPGRHAAIWFVLPRASGRVVAVDGLDAARGADGVLAVALEIGVGDELPNEVVDSRHRALSVTAAGPTPADALRRAQRAAGLVSFTVIASAPDAAGG